MSDEKTILVTGGCGYLGSQFVRDVTASRDRKVHLRILDNLQGGNYRGLMDLPDDAHVELVEGDLLDPAVVERSLREVDVVIHLAALVRTPMGFENPTWVEQVNHWGTARLLEASLAAGLEQFIYVSSIAVYGPLDASDRLAVESDECRPLGPYAQSKRHAEESVLSARERGLPATILRLGTLHGCAPSVRFDAVVNRFAYLAGVGRPLPVHGSGEQVRSFVHVRDASAALHFCISHPDETTGGIFNGVGENASVLDVVEVVRRLCPQTEVRYTEQNIQTRFNFAASSNKFGQLGWIPEKKLTDGVSELIERFGGVEAMNVNPGPISR